MLVEAVPVPDHDAQGQEERNGQKRRGNRTVRKKNGEQRVRDKWISETGNPLQNKCNQTAEKSIEEKKRLHDVPPSVVKAVSWFFKG